MKLHEFQAKQVLQRFGVAVPEGREAQSVDAAVAAYR
jgi:succinyl-CoA synthetase beta subunit